MFTYLVWYCKKGRMNCIKYKRLIDTDYNDSEQGLFSYAFVSSFHIVFILELSDFVLDLLA